MTEKQFNKMKEKAKYIVLKSDGLSRIWVASMEYLKGAIIPIGFLSYSMCRRQIKIEHPANYFSGCPHQDYWHILPEDIAEILYKNKKYNHIKIQGVHFL